MKYSMVGIMSLLGGVFLYIYTLVYNIMSQRLYDMEPLDDRWVAVINLLLLAISWICILKVSKKCEKKWYQKFEFLSTILLISIIVCLLCLIYSIPGDYGEIRASRIIIMILSWAAWILSVLYVVISILYAVKIQKSKQTLLKKVLLAICFFSSLIWLSALIGGYLEFYSAVSFINIALLPHLLGLSILLFKKTTPSNRTIRLSYWIGFISAATFSCLSIVIAFRAETYFSSIIAYLTLPCICTLSLWYTSVKGRKHIIRSVGVLMFIVLFIILYPSILLLVGVSQWIIVSLSEVQSQIFPFLSENFKDTVVRGMAGIPSTLIGLWLAFGIDRRSILAYITAGVLISSTFLNQNLRYIFSNQLAGILSTSFQNSALLSSLGFAMLAAWFLFEGNQKNKIPI